MKPLISLLSKSQMKIFKVKRLDIHGGSIRIYLKKGVVKNCKKIDQLSIIEEEMGLYTKHLYENLFETIKKETEDLRNYLIEKKDRGEKIVGVGAAAKATVLLNFAKLDLSLINCVLDNTSYKQGKFVPGVGIPIYSENKILEIKPDLVVILAWNHAREIISKYRKFYKGEFLIPIPKLKII